MNFKEAAYEGSTVYDIGFGFRVFFVDLTSHGAKGFGQQNNGLVGHLRESFGGRPPLHVSAITLTARFDAAPSFDSILLPPRQLNRRSNYLFTASPAPLVGRGDVASKLSREAGRC